jgi:hypothetical protein
MILERIIKCNLWLPEERYPLWLDLTRGTEFYDALHWAVSQTQAAPWTAILDKVVALNRSLDGIRGEEETQFLYRFACSRGNHSLLDTKHHWNDLGDDRQKALIDRVRRKGQVLAALVWCAWQAAKEQAAMSRGGHIPRFETESDRDELQSLFQRELGHPPLVLRKADLRYLWGWVRTFLDAPVRSSATVDVAHADQTVDDRVVSLHLEVLKGGIDDVFLHPADALRTHCMDRFADAMGQAWKAARGRVEGESAVKCCGRYRVLKNGEAFCRELDGTSAGGAAFRGWYHALKGQVPDPEVIVLAALKLDREGRAIGLEPVDGLDRKVEAIDGLRPIRHDTIVVADHEQAEEVARILKKKESDDVRVVRVVGVIPRR